MRFDRLRLKNFKPYEQTDVRLDRGVTVIHGLNGSGKSSLLEACFFALYGSKALECRLDEVITIGSEDCSIELWFTHDGREYRIERQLTLRGETASTTHCVLETPDGSVEGARDVRTRVSQILRMASESFVNCAYVRQGEVNKLINASPSQRQDMIDDLLQLGRLETYRERASDARVGVGRVRDKKQGELDGVTSQIAELESSGLHDRLSDQMDKRAKLTREIEQHEKDREEAISTRDTMTEVIEEAKEQREEIESLRETVESLETVISETERERKAKTEQLREHKEIRTEKREALESAVDDDPTPAAIENRLTELTDRDEELLEEIHDQQLAAQEQGNRAEQLENTAEEREESADEKRETATELESKLDTRAEKRREQREKIESLRDQLAEKKHRFEDAPCTLGAANEHRTDCISRVTELRERVAERENELAVVRESVEEAQALREEGNCPACGQPVEGSPHVEAIEERQERLSELESELSELKTDRDGAIERKETAETLVTLESEIETLESEIETQEQLLESERDAEESDRERISDLRAEAEQLVEEAESNREQAAQCRENAEQRRNAIGEINTERTELGERIEQLERIETLLEEIDTTEREIERLETRRAELGTLNDERKAQLAEKRERKKTIEERFDEQRLNEAREKKPEAERIIESIEEKITSLTKQRDSLQETIGAIQNQIETLEEQRKREDELNRTVDQLDSLYEETERLQTMYADLRAELRRQNVTKLEGLLNDTFALLYQNDSYARIELSGEYELTVYQKDGEALDPEQLSGGERALFNLSLRCAIYRLLAEGIEGTAPMPPLILDEPTVFLDSGHVSQLLDLIESMRAIGVEQIIVVSHDEELVDAADDLISVHKDSTTNRSSVESVTPDLAPAP